MLLTTVLQYLLIKTSLRILGSSKIFNNLLRDFKVIQINIFTSMTSSTTILKQQCKDQILIPRQIFIKISNTHGTHLVWQLS